MADYTRSFALDVDEDPFVDPDYDDVNYTFKLTGGNLKPATSGTDYRRMVYIGEAVDRGANSIYVELTLGDGPGVYSDQGGPGLFVNDGGADQGKGYWLRHDGNTFYIYQVDADGDFGYVIRYLNSLEPAAETGGRVGLEIYDIDSSPQIRAYYNDVVMGSSKSITAYVDKVVPGISASYQDQNRRGWTAISISGLDLGGFTLDDVNTDNVIDNDTQFVINGDFSSVTISDVELQQAGATAETVAFVETDTTLTCTGIDFHTTEFVDGAVTVSVTSTEPDTLTLDATLDFSNAWVTHTAFSVDPILGMWKDIPAAAAGDISHSPATIAGSAITVDTNGMLMVISPAVATGTTAEWWHFDVDTRLWTVVDATINQDNVTGPTFTTPQAWLVTEGVSDTYDASAYATASDAGSIAYALNPAVSGFSVDSGSGFVSYNGTAQAGQYWLSLDCTDSNGQTTMPQIPVTVAVNNLLITNGNAASISQTTATLLCDTSVLTGDVYFAVSESGPYGAGDIENIIDGTGSVWFQNRSPALTTYAYATGLDPDTQYYYGIVQRDGDDNDTNVLSGSFTTQALPVVSQTGKAPVKRP